MTLILGLGNSQQIALLSDRRFTNWDGSGFSDENTKVASFTCADARLAVAFAGLAKAPGFNTADWLLDSLLECSKPDFLMGPTLFRFGELATKMFSNLRVDPHFLRTTFLFAGYHYAEVPPRAYYWHVSNYEASDGVSADIASESFAVTPRREIRPLATKTTMIITAGNPSGLNHRRIAELREMLASEKPQDALLAKGVSIIRSAAANPKSGSSIGNQISVVIVSADAAEPIGHDYDTSHPTNTFYVPNGVVATPIVSTAFKDVVVERTASEPDSPPMLVPRVGRRSPCPCGSGRRYKNCCKERIHARNVR